MTPRVPPGARWSRYSPTASGGVEVGLGEDVGPAVARGVGVGARELDQVELLVEPAQRAAPLADDDLRLRLGARRVVDVAVEVGVRLAHLTHGLAVDLDAEDARRALAPRVAQIDPAADPDRERLDRLGLADPDGALPVVRDVRERVQVDGRDRLPALVRVHHRDRVAVLVDQDRLLAPLGVERLLDDVEATERRPALVEDLGAGVLAQQVALRLVAGDVDVEPVLREQEQRRAESERTPERSRHGLRRHLRTPREEQPGDGTCGGAHDEQALTPERRDRGDEDPRPECAPEQVDEVEPPDVGRRRERQRDHQTAEEVRDQEVAVEDRERQVVALPGQLRRAVGGDREQQVPGQRRDAEEERAPGEAARHVAGEQSGNTVTSDPAAPKPSSVMVTTMYEWWCHICTERTRVCRTCNARMAAETRNSPPAEQVKLLRRGEGSVGVSGAGSKAGRSVRRPGEHTALGGRRRRCASETGAPEAHRRSREAWRTRERRPGPSRREPVRPLRRRSTA